MKRIILALTLAVLTACTSLGVTTPQTFNEKAYAAALSIDTIQKQADVLLKAKKITVADAENVLKATDVASQGIVLARTYATSAPTTANSKLDASVAALTVLTTYLASQGAK